MSGAVPGNEESRGLSRTFCGLQGVLRGHCMMDRQADSKCENELTSAEIPIGSNGRASDL